MGDDVSSVDRSTERSALHHLLPTHLRPTPRAWAFLLVAALTGFAIVEAGRALYRMRDEVLPGVCYNQKLGVSVPLPDAARAAGIRIGDRIVAVDDQRFDDARAISDFMRRVGVDRAIRLETARRGHHRVSELTTYAPSWAAAWFRLAVGLTFALIGIAVFWFHPGRRESWPFLLGCVAWGVAILANLGEPRTTQTAIDSRLALVGYAAIGPMFLHLFAVFPRPLRAVVRRPWLVVALDVVAIAAGFGLAVLQPTIGPLYVAVVATSAINALALLAIIAIVVWRLRRPAPREDTTRLRALIVAVLVAFPVPLILAVARLVAFTPATDAARSMSMGTGVLFPLIVGYAILRRDLFEIDRAVARAAAASAIVGIAGLVAVGVAFAFPMLVAPDSVIGSPSAMAIVVLGGVAVLWPVKRRVQSWLIGRFGRPDLDERVAAVREALAELAEAPEPALFGRFERRLEEALDVDDAAVLVPEGTGWRRPATGERLDVVGRIVELRVHDELVGALALGRPGSRTALAAKTQRVVDVLVPELARALRSRPTGDHIGGYRIERFLAAGGMGNVYVGSKTGAGGFVKPVAIKQMLPELAVEPAVVDRFLREARLVARLNHPGIVQTLELGETDGGYFMVMEYVDGVDAATLIRRLKRRRERLPLAVAANAATSICLALEHVHGACDEHAAPLHLIHHDVSPHNVLIDTAGNVKLADFGVSRMRHDASPAGQLAGKVGYVAPEQIDGLPYDHRIDVFAAGIVLYELVTLQHPFARGSEEATLRATAHGRYLPPETLREDCPDALARVIARALAPVERRYASAAELAEAIQRVHSLDSRHTGELGRLVRSVSARDPAASASMPAATVSLPTVRG